MAPQMGTQQLIGQRLVDRDGAAVGKIGQVFYDDQTDAAKWITVRTGLFGSRENLVPLVGAEMVYDSLQVPWSRNKIKRAPSFDIDQHISVEQEDRVCAHYGLRTEVPGQRVGEQRVAEQRVADQRPTERYDRPRGRHARPEPPEHAVRQAAHPVQQQPQVPVQPPQRMWEPRGDTQPYLGGDRLR